MLSLKNKRESLSLLNIPFVLFTLIFITIIRIYSIYITPIELSVDEAQYWHWSRNLDFGYFTKPPLIAWVIAISTNIFGNEEWAVRLSAPIIHFITSIILLLCGQIAFGSKIGKAAALIWIFTPAASLGSFVISTDTPLLLFWSLSLFFLFTLIKYNSFNSALFAGVSLGLAFLSKYAALYLLVLVFLWWLIYDRGKIISLKNIIIILITTVIISSLNLYWNYYNDFATVSHTISNAGLSEIVFNYSNVIAFLSSQLLVFGPIMFLIYLFTIFDSFFRGEKLSLLGLISLPILLLITIQSFLKIANPNWAVTAYIGATLLISTYIASKRHSLLKILFKLGLIINFGLSLFILKITLTGSFYPIDLKSNPLRKNLGFEILANQVNQTFDKYDFSTIVFEKRGDITRFNYYLNRFDNKFENKIFLMTKNIIPGNFYEANYKFSVNNFNKDSTVLIVSNNLNFDEKYESLIEKKLIKKISTITTKNKKRTYYLIEGKIK